MTKKNYSVTLTVTMNTKGALNALFLLKFKGGPSVYKNPQKVAYCRKNPKRRTLWSSLNISEKEKNGTVRDSNPRTRRENHHVEESSLTRFVYNCHVNEMKPQTKLLKLRQLISIEET